VLVLDAHDTVSEQDASVPASLCSAAGVDHRHQQVGWNSTEQREEIQRQLALKLDFVPFRPLEFISARRHGSWGG